MIRPSLLLLITFPALVVCRAQPETPELPLTWLHDPATADDQEGSRDPGYPAYREGYRLILNQDWGAARKKFQELIGRHRRSAYVDEARYWSAYALKQIDERKAVEAYREFTRANANSRYFDDAVADLSELEERLGTMARGTIPEEVSEELRHVHPMISSGIRRLSRKVRRLDTLSPHLRVKAEALHALGRHRNDEDAFVALKDVALDGSRPAPLRVAALESLTGFTRFNVIPAVVEIARKDTSPVVRMVAIEVICEAGRSQDQTLDVLIELYSSLPVFREDDRDALVYSIADVGNERAVDFLSRVAMNDSSFEVRRAATYCLGGIGGQKAREALTRILKAE